MKTAEYKTDYSYDICPILDNADLDAMTDIELYEERSNWSMSLSDDDPMAWEVDCNYSLCERHIKLRGMSDEKLTNELEQAQSEIAHWAQENGDRLANRITRRLTVDAEDYMREMRRRRSGRLYAAPARHAT